MTSSIRALGLTVVLLLIVSSSTAMMFLAYVLAAHSLGITP